MTTPDVTEGLLLDNMDQDMIMGRAERKVLPTNSVIIVIIVMIGTAIAIMVTCCQLYCFKHRNQVPNNDEPSTLFSDTARVSIMHQANSSDVLRPITHTMNTRHSESHQYRL